MRRKRSREIGKKIKSKYQVDNLFVNNINAYYDRSRIEERYKKILNNIGRKETTKLTPNSNYCDVPKNFYLARKRVNAEFEQKFRYNCRKMNFLIEDSIGIKDKKKFKIDLSVSGLKIAQGKHPDAMLSWRVFSGVSGVVLVIPKPFHYLIRDYYRELKYKNN
jgi:hypothetical protein